MDDKKNPMTLKGYNLVSDELNHLKNNERPAAIKAIAEARVHGDLSENAEYHAAREQQSFIEGRISELEERLSRSEIIDVSTIESEHVTFGATITLLDEDNNHNVAYQIVGSEESDIKKGLLSVESPLARALIGKKQDDEVEVPTPGGNKLYIIQRIQYC